MADHVTQSTPSHSAATPSQNETDLTLVELDGILPSAQVRGGRRMHREAG